ncbi:H-NS family nucleoid-associated regulatory protein [Caballeronia sp. BR00000012568055]|uniref:H-NS family nucleoid-associated regulatory protein n=1 Tax=Caballeronia sp. BR00000012568055 TaxID=2918761 RepID=UPI0023F8E1DB|nr:H-NS family nucleoid-associated regulatory protein [Caballeronia sp. BR00000012568055]
MVTLKVIQDKIAKLQAQAESIAKKESLAVFGKIRDLMERHGLTPDDIAAHFGKGRAAAKKGKTKKGGAAKYVDPKTGATWTGHGRAPAWIAKAKDRSKFLGEGVSVSASSSVAKKKPAKAGNYPRGPQAPKYRDPASGATWSGRGPAPAWLAAAKNRDDYLIEKVKAVVAKKAAIKKSAPAKKKIAAKKVSEKKNASSGSTVTASESGGVSDGG